MKENCWNRGNFHNFLRTFHTSSVLWISLHSQSCSLTRWPETCFHQDDWLKILVFCYVHNSSYVIWKVSLTLKHKIEISRDEGHIIRAVRSFINLSALKQTQTMMLTLYSSMFYPQISHKNISYFRNSKHMCKGGENWFHEVAYIHIKSRGVFRT